MEHICMTRDNNVMIRNCLVADVFVVSHEQIFVNQIGSTEA